jgi:hypothetical protein
MESGTFTIRYHLSHALQAVGGSQQYTVDADPQAVINATKLTVNVHAPAGWKLSSGEGFTVNGSNATASVVLDEARHLALDVRR